MLDRATLALVAETLADAEDDWWLVGGAAVALQGLDIAIADIDVLMSRRDVVRVIARLGIAPVEGVAIDRIRSEIWARWTAPPMLKRPPKELLMPTTTKSSLPSA